MTNRDPEIPPEQLLAQNQRLRFGKMTWLPLSLLLGAAAVSIVLLPVLGTGYAFVPFYPVVIIVYIWGGFRAGLLATLLSALIVDYFWIEPAGFAIGNPTDWIALSVFFVCCIMICPFATLIHRAKTNATEAVARAKFSNERLRVEDGLHLSDERPMFQANLLANISDVVYAIDLQMRIASRKIGQLVVFCRGITKRKPTEMALRESEERFRNMFERHGAVMMLIEPQSGAIIDANVAATRFYGYSRESLQTMYIEEINQLPHEAVFERKNVEQKSAELLKEVNERKKKEEELHILNRTLTALSKSSKTMMHAQDEHEYLNDVCKIVIEKCNYAMVWIGYGEQDENKTVSPVAHAGFEDGYLDTLRLTWAESGRGLGPTGTAIRTGTICSCRNMLDDPKFLPWREEALKRGYRSSIAIPLMEQGEPFGAVTIYSEKPDPFIESEVRLLTELADDLSFGIQAIRMRHVLEVNEMELRHNIEELALTNKELESFSYSISHDLRAPLRAMKGLCSILLEDYAKRLDPELQEYLSRIISSSNKMSELIENMLSLSKVSRQEVILEQVNLSVIANTIVSELRQVEPANNVEVVIAEQLESHCDSRLISMALFNLIGNAWKYSSKTSCARIEFREMEKEGQKIFYVRDNGAGFDMKFSEKLFTPFQRLHTDREFPGTGIGLAIVKRVIEKHRGSIWAQSETGKGATFYFTLSAGKES